MNILYILRCQKYIKYHPQNYNNAKLSHYLKYIYHLTLKLITMIKKSIAIISLLIFLCSGQLFSQKADSTKRLIFSFGVRANTFLLSDFNMQNMPPARLQLNFDLAKFLRIEAQYGIFKSTKDYLYQTGIATYVNYPLVDKSSIWAVGLFGMKKMDRTNFYAGIRFSKVNYSNDQFTTTSSGGPFIASNTGSINMFSGVLGGEYFFVRRFSIGGEFAFVSMKDVYSMYSTNNRPATTNQSILTETSLTLRFYPF